MLSSRFFNMESGMDFLNENSNTPRKAASENWYMEFIVAISDKTKNKMAPLRAAGR